MRKQESYGHARHTFPLRSLTSACVLTFALTGCASTRFESSGRTPTQSLCQAPGENVSALVVWGPRWRPDQKDVLLREAAARRAIERFFASSSCFSEAQVVRASGGGPAAALSAAEARALAAANSAKPGRVLLITVRELGPVLKLFGSPALVEGGTEVVLEIRSISESDGAVSADFTSHWQHGGPWVIKGVATLEQDIDSALQAALDPMDVR